MNTEKYYNTTEVSRKFGKTPRTIRYWIVVGCTTREGRKVRLAALAAGKGYLVAESELALFESRLRSASRCELKDD